MITCNFTYIHKTRLVLGKEKVGHKTLDMTGLIGEWTGVSGKLFLREVTVCRTPWGVGGIPQTRRGDGDQSHLILSDGRQSRGGAGRCVNILTCISLLCRRTNLSNCMLISFPESHGPHSPWILICLSSHLCSGCKDLVPGRNTVHWLLVQDGVQGTCHMLVNGQSGSRGVT